MKNRPGEVDPSEVVYLPLQEDVETPEEGLGSISDLSSKRIFDTSLDCGYDEYVDNPESYLTVQSELLQQAYELEPRFPLMPFVATRGPQRSMRMAPALPIEMIEIQTAPGDQNALAASILEEVASYYKIDESDILGKSRKAAPVKARQATMYLLRQHTDMSLPKIGKKFGRDHTTVVYAVNKINEEQGSCESTHPVHQLNEICTELVRNTGVPAQKTPGNTSRNPSTDIIVVTKDGLYEYPITTITTQEQRIFRINENHGLNYDQEYSSPRMRERYASLAMQRLEQLKHREEDI